MLLNLESRLAQRVLVEVAARRRTATRTTSTRSPAASTGATGSRRGRPCGSTARRSSSPLQEPELRRPAHQGRGLRPAARGHRRAAERRHAAARPARWCCTSARSTPTLYVDSSGESLFKRGWREDKGDAPLKETLAAAMLAAAGWRGTPATGGALHDPCCGSGTIAIEAAQIACGIAPGAAAPLRLRAAAALRERRDARRDAAPAQPRQGARARAARCRSSPATCRSAWSTSPGAMPSAPASPHAIQFNGGDALERPAPRAADRAARHADAQSALRRAHRGRRQGRRGRGARSAEDRSTPSDFFARLAAHWKNAYTGHPAGWTAWVLSPDMKPAERDAAEGIAPRADVERADRVPAVPLRPGRRLGARQERAEAG